MSYCDEKRGICLTDEEMKAWYKHIFDTGPIFRAYGMSVDFDGRNECFIGKLYFGEKNSELYKEMTMNGDTLESCIKSLMQHINVLLMVTEKK